MATYWDEIKVWEQRLRDGDKQALQLLFHYITTLFDNGHLNSLSYSILSHIAHFPPNQRETWAILHDIAHKHINVTPPDLVVAAPPE
jgi:galactose-1-phosphate uridylyltransferase